MRKTTIFSALVLMLLCGCGDHRTSIKVTPAIASAKAGGGKMQFRSTGSGSIGWCVGDTNGNCYGLINVGVILDGHGLATCISDHPVTATIVAGRGVIMFGLADEGYKFKEFSTATLICF